MSILETMREHARNIGISTAIFLGSTSLMGCSDSSSGDIDTAAEGACQFNGEVAQVLGEMQFLDFAARPEEDFVEALADDRDIPQEAGGGGDVRMHILADGIHVIGNDAGTVIVDRLKEDEESGKLSVIERTTLEPNEVGEDVVDAHLLRTVAGVEAISVRLRAENDSLVQKGSRRAVTDDGDASGVSNIDEECGEGTGGSILKDLLGDSEMDSE